MHRRPWPIVILAAYQVFSPLFGILGAALIHRVSPLEIVLSHWQVSTNLELLESYALPIIVGVALYTARRSAYFFSLAACLYFIYRNTVEFGLHHDEFPIWMALWSNLAVAVAVLYLLLPKVRMIYFDPTLRWWENAPRFVLRRPARLTYGGGAPVEVHLNDLSIGGAGIETPQLDLRVGDEVLVEFETHGKEYLLKGTLAYTRLLSPGLFRLGMKWSASKTREERSRIHRLVRKLRKAKTPTTSHLPYWWDDFKEWMQKASVSRDAWVPPVNRRR